MAPYNSGQGKDERGWHGGPRGYYGEMWRRKKAPYMRQVGHGVGEPRRYQN